MRSTRRRVLRGMPGPLRHRSAHGQAAPTGPRSPAASGDQDPGVRRAAAASGHLCDRAAGADAAPAGRGPGRPASCGTRRTWCSRPGTGCRSSRATSTAPTTPGSPTAGVRRITVHDARRTCATLLVDLDVHPRDRDGDPPARRLLDHDGGLQPGILGRHPRGATPARRKPGPMSCCTSQVYKIGNGRSPGWETGPDLLSGRRDLNPRPLDPQSSALPNCATSRCHLTRALSGRYSVSHAGTSERGRICRTAGSILLDRTIHESASPPKTGCRLAEFIDRCTCCHAAQ